MNVWTCLACGKCQMYAAHYCWHAWWDPVCRGQRATCGLHTRDESLKRSPPDGANVVVKWTSDHSPDITGNQMLGSPLGEEARAGGCCTGRAQP